MKWHDARLEKPSEKEFYMLKGMMHRGSVQYRDSSEGSYWDCGNFMRFTRHYPFYATVEEIERELDSDD
jgi:hypothetical protein